MRNTGDQRMTPRPSPVRPTAACRRLVGRTLARFVMVLAVFAPAAAPGQALTPEVRRIAAAADARRDGAIGLLERVVNIDSATRNLGGVKRAGVGPGFYYDSGAIAAPEAVFHTSMPMASQPRWPREGSSAGPPYVLGSGSAGVSSACAVLSHVPRGSGPWP